MKTDYKILWIDDDHSYVRGDQRNFYRFFKRHGIELKIIEIVVSEGSKTIDNKDFTDAINDIELDIILVDFNMATGENGNDIIKHIRQTLHHYHIPIVFYSADGPEELQRQILKINIEIQDRKNLSDGIYFCHRDDIFDKVEKILISLLKKEERPKRVRGLLMDRVSEIDATIIKLLNYCSKIEVEGKTQQRARKVIIDNLIKRKQKIETIITTLEENDYSMLIKYVVDNYIDFDSARRADLLREILRELGPNYGIVLSNFYNDCEGNVCLSKLRNNYAHKTEKELMGEHDEGKCKYIREETRRHLNNLGKLNIVETGEKLIQFIIEAVEEAEGQVSSDIVEELNP